MMQAFTLEAVHFHIFGCSTFRPKLAHQGSQTFRALL
jgi:hypothetical protein